jgi:hypothetical protein
MTKASVFVIAVLFAFGCSNSKKAKCEKAFDQMKEVMTAMSKAFDEKMGGGKGAADVDAKMDAMKGEFIDQCSKLPDDVIECVDIAKQNDPECRKKLKESGMGGMGMGRKHKADMDDDKKPDDKKPEDKKDDTK